MLEDIRKCMTTCLERGHSNELRRNCAASRVLRREGIQRNLICSANLSAKLCLDKG